MKNAYFSLKAAKRQRVYAASLQEFAAHDYENSSLDAICRLAEISKGGLYEYISSKEELYLHVVHTSLQGLYDYLSAAIPEINLPADVLERFRAVSSAAIDFYLDHPDCVELIVRAGRLAEPELAAKLNQLIDIEFDRMFKTVSSRHLAYPLGRVMELMKWLLAKTRSDFLRARKLGADSDTVRQTYMDEWDFMLTILANGIYQKET